MVFLPSYANSIQKIFCTGLAKASQKAAISTNHFRISFLYYRNIVVESSHQPG